MANSRIARFIMEVAPPQYVSVMRRRTSKMLDVISEEDQREMRTPNNDIHSHNSSPASPFPKISASASSSSASGSASSVSIPSADTKYFLKEVHRSLSSLNH